MASPREIQDNDDRREVLATIKKAANDGVEPPQGFIRVNGKPLGVWLPTGVDAKAIGLKTWHPTRRWTT